MSIKNPSKPRRPSLPAKGGGRLGEVPTFPAFPEVQHTDEFGLGWWARELPTRARQYIARAYEEFHYDKRYQPIEVYGQGSSGTIPEAVLHGGLLSRGYGFRHGSPSFDFQDPELGGRKLPGGAVVDVIVYQNGRKGGVRVSSIYHSTADPFGKGGSETEEARQQRIRLLARGTLDWVLDVNLAPEFCLENGPDFLIDRDLDRIRRAA